MEWSRSQAHVVETGSEGNVALIQEGVSENVKKKKKIKATPSAQVQVTAVYNMVLIRECMRLEVEAKLGPKRKREVGDNCT